jgi:hypothetical protein
MMGFIDGRLDIINSVLKKKDIINSLGCDGREFTGGLV